MRHGDVERIPENRSQFGLVRHDSTSAITPSSIQPRPTTMVMSTASVAPESAAFFKLHLLLPDGQSRFHHAGIRPRFDANVVFEISLNRRILWTLRHHDAG